MGNLAPLPRNASVVAPHASSQACLSRAHAAALGNSRFPRATNDELVRCGCAGGDQGVGAGGQRPREGAARRRDPRPRHGPSQLPGGAAVAVRARLVGRGRAGP